MTRIKVMVAMVAAVMVMMALGAAPAMADVFDGGGCGDRFGSLGFSDRCFDHDGRIGFLTEDVSRPRIIDGLVCSKHELETPSGDEVNEWWECFDRTTGQQVV
jgi:hypothetical protein